MEEAVVIEEDEVQRRDAAAVGGEGPRQSLNPTANDWGSSEEEGAGLPENVRLVLQDEREASSAAMQPPKSRPPPIPLPPVPAQGSKAGRKSQSDYFPETPILPPPSAPPFSETDDPAHVDRLEELIAAPPVAAAEVGGGKKMPTVLKELGGRRPLSEALVTPRGNQVKRHNDYVQTRPKTVNPDGRMSTSSLFMEPAPVSSENLPAPSRGSLDMLPPPPSSSEQGQLSQEGMQFADEAESALALPEPPVDTLDRNQTRDRPRPEETSF